MVLITITGQQNEETWLVIYISYTSSLLTTNKVNLQLIVSTNALFSQRSGYTLFFALQLSSESDVSFQTTKCKEYGEHFPKNNIYSLGGLESRTPYPFSIVSSLGTRVPLFILIYFVFNNLGMYNKDFRPLCKFRMTGQALVYNVDTYRKRPVNVQPFT